MCEAAAGAALLECGREYGFVKSDIRTKATSALDSKDFEELSTNNLFSERQKRLK